MMTRRNHRKRELGSRALGNILIGVLISAGSLAAAATAQASPTMSLSAGFATGTHLSEGTTTVATIGFSGTEYNGENSLPLEELTLRLPKGTRLSNSGFSTCPRSVLEPSGQGPRGCPSGSIAGRLGKLVGNVAFGDAYIPEDATVEPFFAPGGDIYLFVFGHEPVLLEMLVEGHYVAEAGSEGPKIVFSVPLVETVPGGALADTTSLELDLGAFREENGKPVGSVTAPSECTGSLDWEAAGRFTNGNGTDASASREATSPCLIAGKRIGTATRLEVAKLTVDEEELDRYVAIVSPKEAAGKVPTGMVTFRDDGLSVFGCENVPLVASGSDGVASCETYPFEYGLLSGIESITVVYSGDSSFGPSESSPVDVTESTPAELEAHQRAEQTHKRAEEAAIRKATEEAAAKKASEEAANTIAREASKRAEEAARHTEEAFALAARSLASWLAPHGSSAKIGALLEHGGYTTSVSIPQGSSITIDWYMVPAGAHLSARKPTLLATGSSTAGTAHSTKVIIRLTASGRKVLEHRHSVNVTTRGILRSAAGGTSTSLRSFRLGR